MTRMTLLAMAGATALAFAAAPAVAAPDLSGFWALKSDPQAVPAASPTAAGAKAYAAIMAGKGLDAAEGSPDYASAWCTPFGLPWQTTSSLPIDIRQGRLEVTILSPMRAEPRHIYVDGQKHPDPETFDHTTVGHSIGRWQGDVLVTDVTGFSERGVRIIPGGGVRGLKSRLVERYRLAGPDTLRVTYTWTDPQTLRRPHSYTYEFERVKGQTWMPEAQCNPIRAMRAKGLKLPFDAPEF